VYCHVKQNFSQLGKECQSYTVVLSFCDEEKTKDGFLSLLNEATKKAEKMVGECVYLNVFDTLKINTSLA
jgi:hypothetical protein